MNNTTINKKYEILFFPKIKKTIDKKLNEVISVLKSHGVHAAISAANKHLTNAELIKEIQDIYKTVGVRYANDTNRNLKQQERGIPKPIKSEDKILTSRRDIFFVKGDVDFRKNNPIYIDVDEVQKKAGGSFGFNAEWVNWILNYLHQHLIENITYSVIETTRNFILNVLNRSITEGLGIDETVRLLEGSGFIEMQAARIVRTEVNMASNAGTLAAGQTYDYQMQKKWIAVHDNRTRGVNPKDHASHIGLDGTIIDFEDSFVDPRNGDHLQSPGDPYASGESIINCRCQMSLRPKRDKNGRLIPKRQSTVVIHPDRRARRPIVTI